MKMAGFPAFVYKGLYMEKSTFLLTAGFITISLAFSENIGPKPNSLYYETQNKNRANYKASRSLKSSTTNIPSYNQSAKMYGKDFNEDFDSFSKQKKVNRLYNRNIIKQRAKKDPDKYKFQTIRNKKDLEKAGIEINGKKRVKEIYNYTEVKNVISNSFGSKKKEKNIGVLVGKKAKVKKVVNFVDVKNSDIDSSLNMGIKVKSNKIPSKITNSVTLENSEIGE